MKFLSRRTSTNRCSSGVSNFHHRRWTMRTSKLSSPGRNTQAVRLAARHSAAAVEAVVWIMGRPTDQTHLRRILIPALYPHPLECRLCRCLRAGFPRFLVQGTFLEGRLRLPVEDPTLTTRLTAEHLNKVTHHRDTASMTITADKTRDMEISMARTEDSLATAVVTTEEVEVTEETEGDIVVRLAVDVITFLLGVPVVVMVAIKDLFHQQSISKIVIKTGYGYGTELGGLFLTQRKEGHPWDNCLVSCLYM